ncbi:unnamed protein product [Mucor hiemalis]
MIGATRSNVTPTENRISDLEDTEKNRDNLSDLTKEDVTFTEETDEKLHETVEQKGNPVYRLKHLLRGLNSLEANPREFSATKKRLILLTVALASTISPISSTIYLPAIVSMQAYFNCSATTINASLSIFTFLNAIFPLIWAPSGEQFGRRKLYLISFSIAILGTICCAASVNVVMFIVFRGVSAAGSSSVMSMGAGTLSDIYDAHERGRAIALYTCGPLLGPALGPIIGGYLNEAFGWRSNFYFVAALETWRPLPTLPGEKKLTSKEKLKKIQPFLGFQFFRYPNISMCVAFSGIIFMMFYLINTTFTRTYTIQYGLSSGTVGLCYLPLTVGGIIGSNLGGRFADRIYNRRVAAANSNTYPEMRISLELIGFAVFIQVGGFIAYGWCIYYNVHMAWGLVAEFIRLMIPIVTISTYIVDCFRRRSASVTACSNFVRYTMAGIGALIATDMETGLGSGVMYSLCAGIIALSYLLIVGVKVFHTKWKYSEQE